MTLITADKLREKQKDYLDSINSRQMANIQKRLLEVSKTERRSIDVIDISETNLNKLREAGYIVDYQATDHGEFAYIIKW